MIEKLKITTLVDNTAGYGSRFWAEHGLSFLVEADGVKILFDTGQTSGVIGHNLDEMGIGLDRVSHIVLSHGHYDHTGGLEEVLDRAGDVTIVAHPGVFDDKYGRKGGKYVCIGIPFGREELEEKCSLLLRTDPFEIADGVQTTGQIPRNCPFEPSSDIFHVKKDGRFVPEVLLDDQALVLQTGEGTWVVLGCTHSGLVNTLERVVELTGGGRIAGVMGGTHLVGADEERLRGTVDYLRDKDIRAIGLAHCSGQRAYTRLVEGLGEDRVFSNHVGYTREI